MNESVSLFRAACKPTKITLHTQRILRRAT